MRERDTVWHADRATKRERERETEEERKERQKTYNTVSLLNKFISRLNGAEAKYYSEGNAYDYFSNRDGHYFLIRLVCGGGGYCEEYDLIRFDQEGHFISSETIGNLNMEYGNTLSFEYHLLSDTALSVYEVETDTESLKSRDFSHKIVKLFPSPK